MFKYLFLTHQRAAALPQVPPPDTISKIVKQKLLLQMAPDPDFLDSLVPDLVNWRQALASWTLWSPTLCTGARP